MFSSICTLAAENGFSSYAQHKKFILKSYVEL